MSEQSTNLLTDFTATTAPNTITVASGTDNDQLASTAFVQSAIDNDTRTVTGDRDHTGALQINGVDVATEDYVDTAITSNTPVIYIGNYDWDGVTGTLIRNTGLTSVVNLSPGSFQVNMTDISGDYVVNLQPTEGLQGFYASKSQAYLATDSFRFFVRDFATSNLYTGSFTFDISVIKAV